MENLNQLAIETMQNLSQHHYFENLQEIDSRMADYTNPSDKLFYQTMQDRINEISGEFITAYYNLRAELKVYISTRKAQMKLEAETKGAKLAGNELIEDLIKSEISSLQKAVIILEGWVARADCSIKTARNHTYETKEVDSETKES